MALSMQSKFVEALEAFDEMGCYYEATNARRTADAGNAIKIWGRSLADYGKSFKDSASQQKYWKRALEKFEEAKKIWEDLGQTNNLWYMSVLTEMASLHGKFGNLGEATRALQQAFSICDLVGAQGTVQHASLLKVKKKLSTRNEEPSDVTEVDQKGG